jgi:hypothetical protein
MRRSSGPAGIFTKRINVNFAMSDEVSGALRSPVADHRLTGTYD